MDNEARVGSLAIRGADISFTPQVEAAGHAFFDDGRVRPVEHILADHGVNYARLRVWVDPPAGFSDTASLLGMAKRIKDAGMSLLLDPHYSDFWADPAKQYTPERWQGKSLPELVAAVRTYTAELITALAEQGTPADIIQIGNEVTNGMLWPIGQIYRDDDENWTGFTALLGAGIEGALAANPTGQRLRTMVHFDRGGDSAGSRYFFDRILAAGVEFDLIGLSYYPFWHGSMAALRENLHDLAQAYDKDIVVVESSYPWTLDDGDGHGNILTDAAKLPDAYPPTPEGQAAFYADLRRELLDVPGGHGIGFVDWEPAWLPGVGWKPGAGNPNDNLTLFDWDGKPLPALSAFA